MELSIFRLRRSAQIIKYSWWFPVEKTHMILQKKPEENKMESLDLASLFTCILKTVKEKQSSYNFSDVTEKIKEV